MDSNEKLSPKARYDKEQTKMYTFKVIKSTEADIMEKLDSVPNKAGYIKSLIRKDISQS